MATTHTVDERGSSLLSHTFPVDMWFSSTFKCSSWARVERVRISVCVRGCTLARRHHASVARETRGLWRGCENGAVDSSQGSGCWSVSASCHVCSAALWEESLVRKARTRGGSLSWTIWRTNTIPKWLLWFQHFDKTTASEVTSLLIEYSIVFKMCIIIHVFKMFNVFLTWWLA